ncbi:MAG: BON domain-containing protein [Rubrobacter sp.]
MPSTGKKLKGGKLASKAGAKVGRKLAPHAGKTALKLGKAEMKLIRAAMRSREPRSSRYLKYGLFLTVGLALGALIKNVKKSEDSEFGSSSGSSTASDGPPSGSSTASDGPLIGGGGGFVSSTVIPEQQEDIEQTIRSALGQDDRTKDIPKPNVTVNAGVAELRGPVPSEASKSAAQEIASGIEGVREVRNLLVVV